MRSSFLRRSCLRLSGRAALAPLVPALLATFLAAGPVAAQDWNVNEPPFPTYELEINTEEGTWMSLDVSPDGSEIVFDLLGDIYVIPFEGGEARQLTEGMAWNMQPVFSPDGQYIAFTSDRAGGDNIWVMERDGSNPRQITNESFRLLNGPDWTPDSQYIVARKHFTSARSLGAGEMWLYHLDGGTSGLRLTERPNDQQDVNEPVFSPDGRYLYYSQDVTGGSTFQYNKDPNPGIYAIRRLDRETGQTTTVTGGPGGAIRPAPSPDGERLAFIRRANYQSTLYVRELESGREWPLYDGLDRDLQEIWAIHGVYPRMTWTPDGSEIVFWAGGGIHRLDVETRDITKVPFQVQTTRTMAEAHRPRIDIQAEEFDVRMPRWVQVSPDGNRVLYQALGYLWVRELSEGAEPRRLTSQTDHFELEPAWSRDGQQVAFIAWDDQELSTVRVAPVEGAEAGRVVVDGPGHFREPVFTPDGETLLFRRVGGGGLISPLWPGEAGTYRVPVSGGEAVRFTGGLSGMHFGASSDRVYFTRGGTLLSIGLDGHDERQHLSGQFVSDIQVSPDDRWVTWSSRYQAYVRPFVPTGSSVSVSPGSRDVPQRRVSRDAGDFLHWSGDGQTLHWTTGAELFSLGLGETFPWSDDQVEDEVDLPVAEGQMIGFRAQADRPEGVVAFTGARILTMNGDEVIENGTLVVEEHRIAAVGPDGEVDIPQGAHVVDASGHTIMPGLIDVHQHGGQGSGPIIPRQNRSNYATLAFGVTTIHNPSASTQQIFAASEMARAGEVVAPRIFSTGTILYGATSASTAQVNNLDDARSHIRRLGAAGAFSVKSYNQPRRDQRQQILAAAREQDVLVVLEGGALFQHNMTMIQDGHTGIEHSLPLAAVYDDVRQFWGGSDTGYTPTLVVSFGPLYGENYFYYHDNLWENQRLLDFSPPLTVEAASRRRTAVPDDEWGHIETARVATELHREGVLVNLGAHGQRNGIDAHWELRSFGLGGATPMEALQIATLNGARYLGLDHEIGSLEVGKLADLIVLEENPLEGLENTETVRWTMVNGRLFDARTMDEVGNHPREREPFWWETMEP
ncbi:MAG: amidohydrolase [Gemmatimonadales bacterium]|nr:MAG: amidohydrolase [Gemmatimonadales bacterium]